MTDTTIDVPKVGHVKKGYVYGIVGVAGAYLGWKWWTNRSSGSGAPVVAPGVGTYVPPDSSVSSGTTTVNDTTPGPGSFQNDAQWTQYAIGQLELVSVDSQAASIALGLWLANQPLTEAQKAIVITARGLAGNPPSGDHPIISALPTPSTTVHVTEGTNVNNWLAQINSQYGVGLTVEKLQTLNPGLQLGKANNFGYISASNPDNGRPGSGGPAVPVFPYSTDVKIS